MDDTILDVRDLCVTYHGAKTSNPAVRNVSFRLGRERLGIVGESGSGKSTIGRALMRLLPSAEITAERAQLRELSLLDLSERQMLKVRGRRMSMILQDPKFSLNPVRRVGDQVAEAYRIKRRGSQHLLRFFSLSFRRRRQVLRPPGGLAPAPLPPADPGGPPDLRRRRRHFGGPPGSPHLLR